MKCTKKFMKKQVSNKIIIIIVFNVIIAMKCVGGIKT